MYEKVHHKNKIAQKRFHRNNFMTLLEKYTESIRSIGILDFQSWVVKEEQYKSKSDAITDMRFTSIIEGTENLPCLTEAVIQSPEEEDERLWGMDASVIVK